MTFEAPDDSSATALADAIPNTGSRTLERGVAHCGLWREDGSAVTAEARSRAQ